MITLGSFPTVRLSVRVKGLGKNRIGSWEGLEKWTKSFCRQRVVNIDFSPFAVWTMVFLVWLYIGDQKSSLTTCYGVPRERDFLNFCWQFTFRIFISNHYGSLTIPTNHINTDIPVALLCGSLQRRQKAESFCSRRGYGVDASLSLNNAWTHRT